MTAVLSLVGSTESGATVQVAVVGIAFRAPTKVIRSHLRNCRDLHDRLLVYSHHLIAQVGQSAICNRFHSSKQRLARWLLMTSDRAQSRELPLTHEFIAHMVGGPRSAVTEAAAALRATGAIDYRRGSLTIRNLAKLREQACECYGAAQESGSRK